MRVRSLCIPVIALGLSASCGLANAVTAVSPLLFGPLPYLQASDSPFVGMPFSYFHREDFEDGLLNTPGVSASPGLIIGPNNAMGDSVDADNGPIDGFGTSGRSYFSNGTAASFTFTFNEATLGALPTQAGIVWTDVGTVSSGTTYSGGVSFEAFDRNGASLGSVGPVTLGLPDSAGQTAEDRFFGVSSTTGISRITISMNNSTDWEVDHLQYGLAAAVPEPGAYALMLAGLGLIGLTARRRLRR